MSLVAGASAQETSGTLALKTGTELRDPFRDASGKFAPTLIHVEAGSFTMGSRPTEPGFRPQEVLHEVETSAYSIGKFEITNAEFCEFLNDKGNQFDDGIRWVLTDRTASCLIMESAPRVFRPVRGAENRPVVTVSWNAARAYCDWLTAKTGRTYRLPTEAEWERAARAGTKTIWPWGDEFDGAKMRWAGSETEQHTVDVGSFPPNPWGLHDTLGNGWEWVLDCFQDDFYSISPTRDPVLYNDDCWTPSIRGGSFRDGPEYCRPGYRINLWWWGEFDGVTFRVLREETGRTIAPRRPQPTRPVKPAP